MTIKEMKEMSGMNLKQLSEYFGIPYRTMQNYSNGVRECPTYLLNLMEYKLKNENYKKKIEEIKEICNAI